MANRYVEFPSVISPRFEIYSYANFAVVLPTTLSS